MNLRGLFLILAASLGAPAQSVAITFDDGPKLAATPILTPQQRNAALLKALEKHHAKAALFITLGNGADRPEGLALARAWGVAGHALCNHTVTHPDLNAAGVSLDTYAQEILACDRVIRGLPGFQPWFRFTFLREGNTPQKRDGIRSFLKDRGYRNAYVSLDTSDWRLDQRLKEVLERDPKADLEPLRKVYLAHLKQRSEAYRALAKLLLGRELPQVVLLHHNLLNALFLDDVLAQFEAQGWQLISPAEAFADPAYELQPERPAPGQSLLLSLARSRGIQVPDHDRLVDDGDFEIEVLRKQGY